MPRHNRKIKTSGFVLTAFQSRIESFLKTNPGWHSVADIAMGLGCTVNPVYKTLYTERLSHIQRRDIENIDKIGRARQTKMEFSLENEYTTHAEQAVSLARANPGMWAQLSWGAAS